MKMNQRKVTHQKDMHKQQRKRARKREKFEILENNCLLTNLPNSTIEQMGNKKQTTTNTRGSISLQHPQKQRTLQ